MKKSLLCPRGCCLELPAPGMGSEAGKHPCNTPQPHGVMLRSAFAPEPGPHQLSKELWRRKK